MVSHLGYVSMLQQPINNYYWGRSLFCVFAFLSILCSLLPQKIIPSTNSEVQDCYILYFFQYFLFLAFLSQTKAFISFHSFLPFRPLTDNIFIFAIPYYIHIYIYSISILGELRMLFLIHSRVHNFDLNVSHLLPLQPFLAQ